MNLFNHLISACLGGLFVYFIILHPCHADKAAVDREIAATGHVSVNVVSVAPIQDITMGITDATAATVPDCTSKITEDCIPTVDYTPLPPPPPYRGTSL